MKRTHVEMSFFVEGHAEAVASVRTWGPEWTASAQIPAIFVGKYANSDDARAALVRALREVANVIERDA